MQAESTKSKWKEIADSIPDSILYDLLQEKIRSQIYGQHRRAVSKLCNNRGMCGNNSSNS